MQHFTSAPASATPGLDIFAAAWLERLIAQGGEVMVDANGRSSIFLRCNVSDCPTYTPPPADWDEDLRVRRREIDEWMFQGRIKELTDLLELVPGGRAAVVAHASAFATHFYADGGRGFV